ncbi:sugar transferase [uncultured Nitratireductor sp.]|uniref:sugar transferase n=1 Tax=uncultured Nitratireductor sp. TaxID=520953 RepID=UPI0025DF0253|nr:sugar transferase [uncultured Nitratireductor sp.]
MLYAYDDTIKQGLELRRVRRFRSYFALKRTFDVVFSVLVILFLLPAIALISLCILISDGRPVFFRQKRIGRDGRVFECLKFRTMRRDADHLLKELLEKNPVLLQEWRACQKLRNDPRIHSIGHFLRISSLDELPQFLNVLRGDMSVVGPRPIVEDEMARYGECINDYLLMKPGITGLWQVSGRNDTSYAERVQLDVHYFQNRTMLLDLKIVWRTVGVFLFDQNGR